MGVNGQEGEWPAQMIERRNHPSEAIPRSTAHMTVIRRLGQLRTPAEPTMEDRRADR
jgi:hypothetical protein